MTQTEIEKCERLYLLIKGRAFSATEKEEIQSRVKSYPEFRIRLISEFGWIADTTAVANKWLNYAMRGDETADGNELLHAMESLAEKQLELEEKMKLANDLLIEKFCDIDNLAKSQQEIKEQIAEMQSLISRFRHRLVEITHSV